MKLSPEKMDLFSRILAEKGYYFGPLPPRSYDRTFQGSVASWQQTHMDEKGKWLVVDGLLGPKTEWSLLNPGISEKPHGIGTTGAGFSDAITAIDSPVRREIVRTAFNERIINVAEDPPGSNWGDGVEKYIRPNGASPWCCWFVMWVFQRVTGAWPVDDVRRGLVADMWNAAVRKKKITDEPAPGNLMVLLYRNDRGRLNGLGHTEIVVAREKRGIKFNTVGGNVGNRVKVCERAVTQTSLVGFINPFMGGPEEVAIYKRLLLGRPDLVQDNGSTNR